jgi:AcrR family transcriptional regulator
VIPGEADAAPPETKPYRFDTRLTGAGVNRNETVSFYLQTGQTCIDWMQGLPSLAREPRKIVMKISSLKKAVGAKRASARRGAVRFGRPPKELAGEVDERILDVARKVFVERGFEGASIDEIAAAARAGKPTIYARFGDKRALFNTVVLRDITSRFTQFQAIEVPTGATIEERLASLATTALHWNLNAERTGLMRLAVAEARRFPDLASTVSRTARELGTEVAAQYLRELTQSDPLGSLPAFAPERLATTARLFLDLVVLPFLLRALFEVHPETLQAEIGPQVARGVAFFLAACRHGG